LLEEMLKLERWASPGAVVVSVTCLVTALPWLLPPPEPSTLVKLLPLAIGAGALVVRLLLLGRTLRAAAQQKARVEECLLQLRRLFSRTGLLMSIFAVVLAMLVGAMTLALQWR
jgi:hypothetical protein